MSEAPKRIWLLPFDGEQRCWCDHPDPSGMGHEDEADEYIRADLVSEQCVSIPEGHPDLNLAAWLDRRREQIGPWADYIIAEVGKLESEIAHMRSVPTTNNQGINP